MKNLKLRPLLSALLVASAMMWSSNSNAASEGGLFVEPAVTYESGTLKLKYPAPFNNDSNEDIKGLGLGLRLGMHVMDTLFLAVDGRYSQPTYSSSAMNTSAASTNTNVGVTLGLQTPLQGVRVWGTYILDGTTDPEKLGSLNVKYAGKKGYRVGAGVYVAMVSVNLEYEDAKYDGVTVESVGPFAGGVLDKIDTPQKSYILSVSFPIAM